MNHLTCKTLSEGLGHTKSNKNLQLKKRKQQKTQIDHIKTLQTVEKLLETVGSQAKTKIMSALIPQPMMPHHVVADRVLDHTIL